MRISGDEYKWVVFAQSYLLLAKLACQELEDIRENKHKKITRFDPTDVTLIYTSKDLFFPVVFNIKQGIENFIKDALFRIKNENPRNTHDIKDLFGELEKNWPTNLKPFKDSEGNEITKYNIAQIPEYLNNIKNLVSKYYGWNFSNEWKALGIKDSENDMARYPISKSGVVIDTNLIKDEFIPKLHEDCDMLYRTFNDLGYIIAIWKKQDTDPSTSIRVDQRC